MAEQEFRALRVAQSFLTEQSPQTGMAEQELAEQEFRALRVAQSFLTEGDADRNGGTGVGGRESAVRYV